MAREPQPRRPLLTGTPENRFEQLGMFVDDLLRYLSGQTRTELRTTQVVGGQAFRVAVDSITPPDGVVVLRAESSPGVSVATTTPLWQWVRAVGENRQEIEVTTLGGLTSGTLYTLTLMIIGGS